MKIMYTVLFLLIFSVSNVWAYGVGKKDDINTKYYKTKKAALDAAYKIEENLKDQSKIKRKARLVCRNQSYYRVDIEKRYVELNPTKYIDQEPYYSAKVVFYIDCNMRPT